MLGYDYICMHGFPTTFSLCNSLNKRFPRIPVFGRVPGFPFTVPFSIWVWGFRFSPTEVSMGMETRTEE